MPEIDFGNVVLLATGDKSYWRLWREKQGKRPLVLQKMGTIKGKESTILDLTELKGSKAIITQKGIALFNGKTLVIKTTRESERQKVALRRINLQ